jgi:ribosome maturation protein SDO1
MSRGKPISYDKERVSFNLARLKKGGKEFEVVVEPDNAIAFKKGSSMDIREVLRGEHIFSDAKKGVLASDNDMKAIFNTDDPLKVALIILKEGEIQLTTEYREKLREDKKKHILYIIQRNAIDPTTKLPHPMTRIENAFEQIKFKVDEFKNAEEQVDDVVKHMMVVMPIRLEQIILQIDVPSQHAHQAYGVLKKIGTIKKDAWGSDGSLSLELQIPAGLQEEVMEKLNSMTHGGVDVHIKKELK